MKFFQKLWHKNGIKKLPRAFFECAGYVRVLNKLVCGKMCGFLENRPKSCGFYEKNYGNTERDFSFTDMKKNFYNLHYDFCVRI